VAALAEGRNDGLLVLRWRGVGTAAGNEQSNKGRKGKVLCDWGKGWQIYIITFKL
jgi:hypothetical protein